MSGKRPPGVGFGCPSARTAAWSGSRTTAKHRILRDLGESCQQRVSGAGSARRAGADGAGPSARSRAATRPSAVDGEAIARTSKPRGPGRGLGRGTDHDRRADPAARAPAAAAKASTAEGAAKVAASKPSSRQRSTAVAQARGSSGGVRHRPRSPRPRGPAGPRAARPGPGSRPAARTGRPRAPRGLEGLQRGRRPGSRSPAPGRRVVRESLAGNGPRRGRAHRGHPGPARPRPTGQPQRGQTVAHRGHRVGAGEDHPVEPRPGAAARRPGARGPRAARWRSPAPRAPGAPRSRGDPDERRRLLATPGHDDTPTGQRARRGAHGVIRPGAPRPRARGGPRPAPAPGSGRLAALRSPRRRAASRRRGPRSPPGRGRSPAGMAWAPEGHVAPAAQGREEGALRRHRAGGGLVVERAPPPRAPRHPPSRHSRAMVPWPGGGHEDARGRGARSPRRRGPVAPARPSPAGWRRSVPSRSRREAGVHVAPQVGHHEVGPRRPQLGLAPEAGGPHRAPPRGSSSRPGPGGQQRVARVRPLQHGAQLEALGQRRWARPSGSGPRGPPRRPAGPPRSP